jgi:ribosomal protein S18 acetylase RimI-like enzyme
VTVLRDGLDGAWLEAAAARDPLLHAYALWDRANEPDRTRFISFGDDREVIAYLLIWRGADSAPMVHWVGPSSARPLLDAFPPRPFLAVVPPDLVEEIERRRGPIATYGVEMRSLADRAPLPPEDLRARRLTRADAEGLRAFVAGEPHRLLEGYRELDLEHVPVFGAFEDDRLVAVAKASVVLRRVWVLTGIVTATRSRGRGFGRAVTTAALRAAVAAGARPGLYVRVDNPPAVALYDSLGFEVIARRAWIDAGAARPP